ncbi:MAG: hypothetical protein U0520_00910 [Candidatus Saccharimonadales bacterium]
MTLIAKSEAIMARTRSRRLLKLVLEIKKYGDENRSKIDNHELSKV